MPSSTTIPANVQRAVAIYAARRRWFGVGAAMLIGIATAGAVAVLFMVADRYFQLPQLVRDAGPKLAEIALLAGAVGALTALFRRHDPFRVAVQLDQAFPENLDRWSSSLDLAEQIAAGRNAGDKASLDRLFADTEALPAASAKAIVPLASLRAAIVAISIAGVAVLFVKASPAFDFPLLWSRFAHPRADLPRDSAIRIVLVEVNGKPFDGVMPGPLPEGSPLNLHVELRRKPGIFAFGRHDRLIDDADQLPPRLRLAATGATPATTAAAEFTRAGNAWTFSFPRLEKSLEFRIGVDDGLTQTFAAEVSPRIKLSRIEAGIHFPRYTRQKDQPMTLLQGNRIGALADSKIDFNAVFDRPFKRVMASFEATKSGKDTDAGDAQSAPAPKENAAGSSRRNLLTQNRGDTAVRFTLPVDASGILRLSAIGANGLASEEWVGAVEATPDAPPRIVVTGVDPDTTIVQGETVSFQYQAEDDLAVTDIVMDWSVAGGIHVSELGGEEYLRNSQLGQKTVAGQELIQRMNYKFYATEPFQFFLTAVDSKGQESHTETFRIHVVSDDYATRFDRGMEVLKDTAAYQNRFLQQLNAITGQLNIIATASGDSKKFDPKLNTQLENFLRTAQNYDDPWFFTKPLTLRYGGIPYRLNRSLQLLMAPPTMLASRADFLTLGLELKTTDDLPGVIEKIRTLIAGQRPILEAWGKALVAEKARFLPEHLLNQARGPAARLAELARIQQPPEVATANLKFYLGQIDAWLAAAAPVAKDDAELQPLLDALKAAREKGQAAQVVTALEPIIRYFSSRDLPPDDALPTLSAAMAQTPSGLSGPNDRFATLIARLVLTTGQNELLTPAETIALAKPWMSEAPAPGWYPAAADPLDATFMAHQVWEALRIYRADILARRFDLNPQDRIDREAVLRELAMGTKEAFNRVPTEGIDSTARDRATMALDRLVKPGAAATDAALPADLAGAIRAMFAGINPQIHGDEKPVIEQLVTAMRKTADEYDRHADAVVKESTRPPDDADPFHPTRMLLLDEATRLQTRTEGMESLYRAVKLGMIESRLQRSGAPPQWSELEPYHGAQLGLSLAASGAGEGVTRIHVELSAKPAEAAQKFPIAAKNAKQLAERLRSTAQLLEDANGGKPVSFDYGKLMKDARAEGLLGAMKEEYELVRAHLLMGDAGANADLDAKLNKSALARIVHGEQSLHSLTQAANDLKHASQGTPAEAADALKKLLGGRLSLDPESPAAEALSAALKEASAAPATESVAKLPALRRRLQAATEALANLADSYADQAKLPVINTTAQQNRRFTTRDLPNVWVIQGVIDGFDRRWLRSMRDLELSLTRTMLEVGPSHAPQKSDASDSADAMDLKLQYGRMVEWRARNFANDRRRNQGISLLAADAGPTLRLPQHIAEEFLRARNLQAPDDFKPRIESYYEELYRDLAR